MLGKLKAILFPCEQTMKLLMSEHHIAVQDNATAHKRLLEVCSGASCQTKNTFPELKDGHIVNPR